MSIADIAEEIAEAKRELRMRYRVYPGLVRKGNMTQQEMDHYLLLQHRIIDRLESVEALRQLALFEEK